MTQSVLGPRQRNFLQDARTGLESTRRTRSGEGGRRGHSTQAANTAMARQGGGACDRSAPPRSPTAPLARSPAPPGGRSGSAGAMSSAPAPPARARITYTYVLYLFICNNIILFFYFNSSIKQLLLRKTMYKQCRHSKIKKKLFSLLFHRLHFNKAYNNNALKTTDLLVWCGAESFTNYSYNRNRLGD